MKIGGVPKLLYFFAKVVLLFSFLDHHQKLLLPFLKHTYDIIYSYVLLMFLALSILVVAIFFGGSLKQSFDSEDSQYHCSPLLSILELYPLSYKAGEEILDESYSIPDIVDETYRLTNIVAEDNHEFSPRVVHLELTEGATGFHGDYKDFIPRLVQVEIIEGAIRSDKESVEFHEYDGYDEDNHVEGDKDDVDSTDSTADDGSDKDDLKMRIEEFIAKNILKWKEESLVDKVQYLEY